MRLSPYLCLGGVEIANDARVSSYVRNVGIPLGGTMSAECACDLYDHGFDTPGDDPAPWWEETRPESEDFLGLMALNIRLDEAATRESRTGGVNGSALSPERMRGRVVPVTGYLFARSAEGMYYGERWLSEALRGNRCDDISLEDLIIVPACPEAVESDEAEYYRTLVDVGRTDGPNFTKVSEIDSECYLQQVNFTLVSSRPWLYRSITKCLDAVSITGEHICSLETPEWTDEGTFRIEIENTGATQATDIIVQGQISLDGSCPVSGLGTSVPLSWAYTVPTLEADDRIIIDGARRKVIYYDASEKFSRSGLPFVDFTGPFRWPDVGVCTTMCLSVTRGTGTVEATVDSYLREV